MKIKVKKLHADARIPTYATDGSGAVDLYAIDRGDYRVLDGRVRAGERVTFRTGLAFEIPPGHVMLVFSRSGHGFKASTRLANCVGVIDSDYRGEVMVALYRDYGAGEHIKVSPGDRIAQAIVIQADRMEFELADELSETDRGKSGFGSTGS